MGVLLSAIAPAVPVERNMMPFDLTDAEREFLTRDRSLTTDEHGREHLFGLSFEETAEYLALLRSARTGSDVDPKRLAELSHRHESVRRQLISGELELN